MPKDKVLRAIIVIFGLMILSDVFAAGEFVGMNKVLQSPACKLAQTKVP